MLADTDVIRALARRLRERAAEIRDEARDLTRHADRTSWRGLAADAMRARVEDRATGLARAADRHEDAADALDRHAARVEDSQGLVRDLIDRDLLSVPLSGLDPRRIAALLP